MILVDEHVMRAPAGLCFDVARNVERWPDLLEHYRWVRFLERADNATGRVEMAAWRDFQGPVRYPTWWVSDMRVDALEPAIFFRHVDGITTGMDVKWSFLPDTDGTRVRIVHDWQGPGWPLIGALAWRAVIAPHFVSAIARRTLAGVAREAERRHRAAPPDASSGRSK